MHKVAMPEFSANTIQVEEDEKLPLSIDMINVC